MEVSWTRGTSKSSILVRFSSVNHPCRGTPMYGNTHMGGSHKWRYPQMAPKMDGLYWKIRLKWIMTGGTHLFQETTIWSLCKKMNKMFIFEDGGEQDVPISFTFKFSSCSMYVMYVTYTDIYQHLAHKWPLGSQPQLSFNEYPIHGL